MSLRRWLSESASRVRRNGFAGGRRSAEELYIGALRRADAVVRRGRHVYDRDWDLLVVLDACRADLMSEVADEYEFVDHERTWSVAGGSMPWMERTFTDDYRDEMRETTYVTANPFSDDLLGEAPFDRLLEVWRDGWDDDLGTVPARVVTDTTIAAARDHSPGRLIAHYMQPHHPFVPDPLDEGINRENPLDADRPVWDKLADGEVDPDRAWDAYRDNLRYVLDDVSLLLDNVDASRVVITADHGNAFGELGKWGHGEIPIDAVREVPWCETVAQDTGGHDPSRTAGGDTTPDEAVSSKLRDLGYV